MLLSLFKSSLGRLSIKDSGAIAMATLLETATLRFVSLIGCGVVLLFKAMGLSPSVDDTLVGDNKTPVTNIPKRRMPRATPFTLPSCK